MSQITLITIGQRMPSWISTACKEYEKRLASAIDLESITIKAVRYAKANAHKALAQEAKKIESVLRPNMEVIVLDETGRSISSQQMASVLAGWLETRQHIAFVIGGANGIAESIKQRAHQIWSLSALTLPHAFVRVLITEQIYRAWSILQNHPYHRSG